MNTLNTSKKGDKSWQSQPEKIGRKRFWDLCDDSRCLILLGESQGRCMRWYLLKKLVLSQAHMKMFQIAISMLFEWLFSSSLGVDSQPGHVSLGTSFLGWR
jgi:hypothetical protein